MRLISRPRQNMLRRIYAVDSTVIPAGHITNMPVTMALSTLRQTFGDWAVEPRSLGTGILAARTLMRDEGRRSAIQVMNASEEDFVLHRGEFIGEAEKVTAADNEATATPTGRPVEEPDLEEGCDNEHIQVAIENLSPELDLDQRTTAEKFIRDRAGLFSKLDYDIGRTNLVQHVIDI